MMWPTAALLDALLAGFYLFVGIYHALLYVRRREMKAYLWLALLCGSALTVDLSSLIGNLSDLEPMSVWLGRLNSLGVAGATLSLFEFASALCERRPGRGARLLEFALLLWSVAFAPERTGAFQAFLAGVLIFIAASAWIILKAARSGNPEARTAGWGLLALAAALSVDVMMNLNVLPAVAGVPFAGFTLLFLSLAVSLSNRFERAHRELDTLRVDLERRVEERTRALNGANRRLRRYFPARVVERILSAEEEVRPRTERREVTILFADLVAFTDYSDGADPQAVSTLINEYITAMLAEIDAQGGTLDKVMGDGLMAFWGAPASLPPEEQARRAVEAAVAMQRRLVHLSDAWEIRGMRRFQARIGIHQAMVAVGDIGTADLWSFTAIGQGVNTAARLERLCPPGKILISGPVARHVEREQTLGPEEDLVLKGLFAPVRVRLLDPEDNAGGDGA